MSYPTPAAGPLFRIDRFQVPPQAAAVFLQRIHRIQQLLDGQPGCRQNLVLSQPAEGEALKVMTVVEWADADAMAAAKSRVQQRYAEEGFNPAAFMAQLGVEAEFGQYAHA